METVRHQVNGIPAILVVPENVRGPLVLWMTHLSGSAEQTLPTLERLAVEGHPAVSFDPVLHGERSDGTNRGEFGTRILRSFRSRMWPILGQTTLDAMSVLTWAQQDNDQSDEVLAGGVSMGGDVAIALAGVDERVARVATIGSTPDWQRPGMRELSNPEVVIEQGEPDTLARWFEEQLDPARHLDRYRRGVPMLFELGGADFHIPADNARAFRERLGEIDPHAADCLTLHVRPGLDHLGIATDVAAWSNAVSFLLQHKR